MDWEAVGAISEIAGVVTVVVTLFYLAVQVKHSASVAKAVARSAVAQMNIVNRPGFTGDSIS